MEDCLFTHLFSKVWGGVDKLSTECRRGSKINSDKKLNDCLQNIKLDYWSRYGSLNFIGMNFAKIKTVLKT